MSVSNDLRAFTREVAVAESVVSARAMQIAKMLKDWGHHASVLNVGITPSEGQVGVVVEFRGELTKTEEMSLYDSGRSGL